MTHPTHSVSPSAPRHLTPAKNQMQPQSPPRSHSTPNASENGLTMSSNFAMSSSTSMPKPNVVQRMRQHLHRPVMAALVILGLTVGVGQSLTALAATPLTEDAGAALPRATRLLTKPLPPATNAAEFAVRATNTNAAANIAAKSAVTLAKDGLQKDAPKATAPVAADLAETTDITLTTEVKQLAQQLDNNPTKIFAWAYDNIRMVPTWGASQTTAQVLDSRRGNAHDNATALIGLLRAANVPARYITGTIEVPIGIAQSWLGGVDAAGVQRLLTQGGIRHTAIVTGGTVQAIQMEHVWIEAWIDYAPARGALPARVGGGDTWVPLDAAFKRGVLVTAPNVAQQINYSSTNLTARLNAATLNNSTRRISAVTSAMLLADAAAHKDGLDRVIAAGPNGAAGATTAELFTRSDSTTYQLGFLAGTLQYKIITTLDRAATLTDAQRWAVRVSMYASIADQQQNRTAAIWTGTVGEAQGKTIAMTFTPDAAGLAQLAQNAATLTQQLPAYLINGTTHLRLDGVSQGATGNVLLGSSQAALTEIFDPRQNGWYSLSTFKIAAGEAITLYVDSGSVTTKSLATLRDKTTALKTALAANDASGLSNTSTATQLLSATAQLYRGIAQQEADAMRTANNAMGSGLPTVTLTRSVAKVDTVSGAVRTFVNERVALDALFNGEQIVGRAATPTADARLQHALAGRVSTRIAQLLDGLWANTASNERSASTSRAFRAALDASQSLQAIATDNVDAALATVDPTALNAAEKSTITDAIRTGQLGVIHSQAVNLGAWQGAGFALSDAVAGVTKAEISALDSGQLQRTATTDLNEFLFFDAWKTANQATAAQTRIARVLDGTLTRVPQLLAALNASRTQLWSTDPRAGSITAALWLNDFSNAAATVYGADNARSLTLLAAGDSAEAEVSTAPYKDQPPRFVSAPVIRASAGDAYRYAIQTTDPQGYPVTLRLVSPSPAPTGMTLANGVLAWTAPVAGTYSIIIEANNGKLTATQSYSLTVTAGASLTVQVDIAPQFVAVGQVSVLSTNAIGGRAPRTVTATVDGAAITLDANGKANVPTTVAGGHKVVVTVTDSLGATTSATQFYGVAVAGDTTKPEVKVTAPADGDEVKAATDIVATITDANVAGYAVMVSPADLGQWTEIARGAGNPPAGVVGRFNPAGLVNGLYDIVVVAWDANGNTFNDSTTIMVSGEAKPGQLRLTFQDAQVEVAGLPLTVRRTYDTRRRAEALDFGYGWSVDYQEIKIQTNGILGTGWEVRTVGNGFGQKICIFATGARIATVRLPGGKLERFDFKAKPECTPTIQYTGFVQQEFVARAGTTSVLEATDVGDLRVVGGDLVDFGTTESANPQAFKLTALDGTQYFLDRSFGIKSIKDQYGNTLTFDDNGIKHSDGKSLIFKRDTPVAPAIRGRISKVTLPDNTFLTYSYDASGNLTSMTDLRGNQSRFTYDSSHSLVDYYDASGNLMMKSEYDADGRLIRQTDALGNAIALNRVVINGVPNPVETIVDRRGNATEYTYDAAGNITSTKDAKGGITSYTYDSNQNETSVTDPLGNKTTRTFDGNGNVLEETNSLGQKTVTAYNLEGKPTQITDALGRVTKYKYGTSGNPETLTDADGKIISLGYSLKGELASLADASGNSTTYSYGNDASGQRVKLSETDANGNTTSYQYDANGRQTGMSRTRTSNDGSNTVVTVKTSRTYDAAGNILTDTDATGATTTNTYTAQNKLATSTDARGNKTSFDYNARGELTKTTYPDSKTETSDYDANGNVIKRCDRAGRCAGDGIDALDRVTDTIPPGNTASQTQRTTYDAAGRAISTTDERGNTSTHAYDSAGKKTSSTDAQGRVTTYAYDAAGNMTSATDARNNVTTYSYDALNRRTLTTFPDNSTAKSSYDAIGRKTSDTDQAGFSTRYAYDKLSRLTQVEDGITAAQLTANPNAAFGTLGKVTSYSYDELGNKLSQTDAQGRITKWDYDNAGRIISRTLPGSTAATPQTERFSYDLVGNRVSHTDFNGKQTRWDYDSLNRPFKETRADGTTLTTTFTDSGTVASITQTGTAGTRVQGYRYDLQDRLIEATSPEGTITYSYDAAGNRASHTTTSSSGTATSTSIEYDSLNRPIKQTDTLGTGANAKVTETTWKFDANGNKVEQHVKTATGTTPIDQNSGIKSIYSYDALNRLTGIEQRRANDATATGLIASYAYTLNARGQKTQVVETSAAITGANATPAITRTKTYTYNPRNQLAQEKVVTQAGTGANISTATRQLDYTYDAAGNQSQKIDAFTAAGSTTAQTTTTVYTVDANDRLTTETLTGAVAGTTTYQYDTNGSVTKKTQAITAPTTSNDITEYTWVNQGGSNALTSVTLPNGQKVSYRYDASGNKIADIKQASAASVPSTTDQSTSYLIDGNVAFAQVMQTATINATGANASQLNGVKVFNRSLGGELLVQQNNGSVPRTLISLADAQASVRILADSTGANGSSPNAVSTLGFDGYGQTNDPTNGASLNAQELLSLAANNATLTAFGYDGEQIDPDSGLIYLRARWYNPSNGRFLSIDPHPGMGKLPLTLNDYAFASGDPVGGSDPSGLFDLGGMMASVEVFAIQSAIAYARFEIADMISNALLSPIIDSAVNSVSAGRNLSLGSPAGATILTSFAAMCRVSSKCYLRKIPTLVNGFQSYLTSWHILDSLMGNGDLISEPRPLSFALLRGPKQRKNEVSRAVRDLSGNCNAAARNRYLYPVDCDEYPYGSTLQGGDIPYFLGQVSLRFVPTADNRTQGSLLGKFYKATGTTSVGKPFLNLSIPSAPAFYIDKSGKASFL
jgi:RHS repeat-associated protein